MKFVWLFEMEDVFHIFSTREKAIQYLKERAIPQWMAGNGKIIHEEHNENWSMFTIWFPTWEEMDVKGFNTHAYITRHSIK